MAKRRKLRRLTSRQFTRLLPKLKTEDIDRYIKQTRGKLTHHQTHEIFARQQRARLSADDKKRAIKSRNKFRPRKSDRGKILLISPAGKRNPKGKGLPIYVTKSGKKWLLKQPTSRPYKAGRKRDINLPLRKTLRNASREFQKAKLVKTGGGRSVQRGHGKVITRKRSQDFRQSVVEKIAKSLKKTIEGQASQRSFLIEVNLLLRHSDGTTSATSFSLPIDKADHISIRLGGLRNFVQQKFYAFLARALQYIGFISAGSAAHIKRVTGEEVDEEVWAQYHSDAGHNVPSWSAPRFEVVKIEQIEWRIKQAK